VSAKKKACLSAAETQARSVSAKKKAAETGSLSERKKEGVSFCGGNRLAQKGAKGSLSERKKEGVSFCVGKMLGPPSPPPLLHIFGARSRTIA
jgi:hypothetical protein